MKIDKIRLFLLCIAWLTAIINVVFGQVALALANAGVLSLLFFFVLTLSRLKKESIAIVILLLVVAYFLMDRFPSYEEFLSGGRFTLVFAALLPDLEKVPKPTKDAFKSGGEIEIINPSTKRKMERDFVEIRKKQFIFRFFDIYTWTRPYPQHRCFFKV